MKRTTVFLLLLFAVWLHAQTSSRVFIPMVNIHSGSFYMGSEGFGPDYDESPVHKVVFPYSFKMSKTEITNRQYEAFCPEHRRLRGVRGLSSSDEEAVIMVSYNDAMAFCKWLSEKEGKNYRLPTEAEWEYACKAGTYTLYNTGDGLPEAYCKNQETVRNYGIVSLKVGQTLPNSYGLYDMHGNVEEWCLDWYAPYSADQQINPAGALDGEFRVCRGGSHNTPVEYLRSTNRMAQLPNDRNCLTGFRIVEAAYQLNYKLRSSVPSLFQTDVCQINKVWKAVADTPVFDVPIPYVIPPSCGNCTPFYKHNHQPAITWCDNGDLLAIWFSAMREEGREVEVLCSRLRNGSDKWEEASSFFKVPDRNMTGSALLNDGKGTLYHLNGVEAAGSWQNLAMVERVSKDNGCSWSTPRIIASEHTKRHQIIAGTIRSREGWLIQLCDAGPEGNDGTAIHISKDGGNTWHDLWDGASLPNFVAGGSGSTIAGIHAGIVQLYDGSLMALGRGCSIKDKLGRWRMPVSISSDEGRTWHYDASEFPPIDGGQRLVFLRLHEGPLLLISFTDHPQRTPEAERGMLFKDENGKSYMGYGLYAALSFDEGKTWPVKRLLTDGKEHFLNGGAWTGFFMMDKTHAEPRGYMAATQTPDGMLHLLSSRLYYRFNLAWLVGDIQKKGRM